MKVCTAEGVAAQQDSPPPFGQSPFVVEQLEGKNTVTG